MPSSFRAVLLALSAALLSTPQAGAQERRVPETRQELKLSFAPVVAQTTPAVVNIYATRTEKRRAIP